MIKKRKLRVAQIAPFWFSVPPLDYGGTERVVSCLTEELVKRGHDVTLFATSESKTKAKLISPIKSSSLKYIQSYLDPAFNAINTEVCAAVFKRANEFDIIHSHAYYFPFFFCNLVKTPVIHTLHNQLPREKKIENEILEKYKHLNYISISDEFQTHFDLNYVGTVYNGLDLNYFPYGQGGDNLLWLGRFKKNKGEDVALKIAQETKKPISICASLRPGSQMEFKQFIKSYKNTKIKSFTNVKYTDTAMHYGLSKAFIFPVQWKEPFGLIMIEAMACGTPVIAFAKGSTPEIIKDGQTGFLVNPSIKEKTGNWIIKKTGIEGLKEAVHKIYSLPVTDYTRMRRACRTHVEKYFTKETMTDNYEKIYKKLCL